MDPSPAASPAPARNRRGRAVVDRVHEQTLARLAEVGFERLTIPDVAERAGVNKTTLYRRWPTKEALVADALMGSMHAAPDAPDTGTLEGDLLALARGAAAFATSPAGAAALRTLLADGVALDTMRAAGLPGTGGAEIVDVVLRRATERRELRPDADLALLGSVIAGAVLQRVFVERAAPTDTYLAALIRLVLHGAAGPAR